MKPICTSSARPDDACAAEAEPIPYPRVVIVFLVREVPQMFSRPALLHRGNPDAEPGHDAHLRPMRQSPFSLTHPRRRAYHAHDDGPVIPAPFDAAIQRSNEQSRSGDQDHQQNHDRGRGQDMRTSGFEDGVGRTGRTERCALGRVGIEANPPQDAQDNVVIPFTIGRVSIAGRPHDGQFLPRPPIVVTADEATDWPPDGMRSGSTKASNNRLEQRMGQ